MSSRTQRDMLKSDINYRKGMLKSDINYYRGLRSGRFGSPEDKERIKRIFDNVLWVFQVEELQGTEQLDTVSEDVDEGEEVFDFVHLRSVAVQTSEEDFGKAWGILSKFTYDPKYVKDLYRAIPEDIPIVLKVGGKRKYGSIALEVTGSESANFYLAKICFFASKLLNWKKEYGRENWKYDEAQILTQSFFRYHSNSHLIIPDLLVEMIDTAMLAFNWPIDGFGNKQAASHYDRLFELAQEILNTFIFA